MAKTKQTNNAKKGFVELIPDKQLPQVKLPALQGAAVILHNTAVNISENEPIDRKLLEMAITVIDYYNKVEKKPDVKITGSLLFCMREAV